MERIMDAKGIAIKKKREKKKKKKKKEQIFQSKVQNTYRETIFLSKTLRDVHCCLMVQRSPKPCSSNACRNLGIESQHFTAITLGHNPRK
jgi:hypothetical protein